MIMIINYFLYFLILIYGNKYLVDICVSIIAIMSLHEYFHSFKEQNENKDLRWIAYISALLISIIHIIPQDYILLTIAAIIPISILVLFILILLNTLLKHIAYRLFGKK